MSFLIFIRLLQTTVGCTYYFSSHFSRSWVVHTSSSQSQHTSLLCAFRPFFFHLFSLGIIFDCDVTCACLDKLKYVATTPPSPPFHEKFQALTRLLFTVCRSSRAVFGKGQVI